MMTPEPVSGTMSTPAAIPEAQMILGTAPNDFDPARDIVIGPWSFVENPTLEVDSGSCGLADLYATDHEMAEAVK